MVPSSALAAPQLPATPEPGEHEPADAEAEPDVEGSAVVYNPVQPRHPVRVLWQSLFRQRVRVERPRNEAYLRSTPLFEDLTRRELRLLRGVVFQRTYGAGETVCAQGTPGAAMFIVRSGAVALTVEPPGGPPVHVLTLREGTFFGERALLEDEPRGFTARAEEETELLVLFRSDVERLIANHPHMGVRIFRKLGAILGVRLQMLREQLLPKAL